LTATLVQNLLTLIQQQIAGNCPGSATELQLWADAANTGSISVGAAGNISGPLSATNYAYQLTPTGGPRIYRSTYPGASVPIGELQVLAGAAAVLHVEVYA
jgi:hypothetical protein